MPAISRPDLWKKAEEKGGTVYEIWRRYWELLKEE